MEWMVAAFLFWVLQQLAKSHPLSKPFTLKPSEKWKSPIDIIYPKLHLPLHRRKRSIRSDDNSLLVLRTTNDTFYIKLKPNEDLVEPNRLKISSNPSQNSCHYHGTVLSHKQGTAAISICGPQNKMSGVIVSGKNAYVLRPMDHLSLEHLPDNLRNSSYLGKGAHIIMKMDNPMDQYCGGEHKIVSPHESTGETFGKKRIRRSSSDSELRKVIETAIYVDYPLYHKLSVKKKQSVAEMQDTILAILNEVQLIYNYQSLKTKFKIVVIKLEIISEGKEGPDAADGDIDLYLDNFCSWQSSKNPPINSELHWDHALMLSG
ncbi:a disintegrin and metalloproteinase with thrombospondin motifs adt-1 [Trichonephila inaurata madagascariensis]|uniref:A disintegrin and metalloproteinase with thrombospondin motifs adt-1 n=1 Tax=Trichonephila inaurata madagascariensis TaxID=2747483 RepID=A0A8X6XVE1_9ARAC|nr:a disintegrin and metalloproteinase with thrombospondin motifs adt-1 [Trichonephila inaurata madagascariensis]